MSVLRICSKRCWGIQFQEKKHNQDYYQSARPCRLVQGHFVKIKLHECHLITHIANAGGLNALVRRQPSTFGNSDKAITGCF